MQVIITSPHGTCSNQYDKLCDKRAEFIAKLLNDKIIKLKEKYTTNIEDPVLFLSDTIYRHTIDLNRLESRSTEWRNKIRETINSSLKNKNIKRIILFDIHSFPNDTKWGYETKMVILNNILSRNEGIKLYNYLFMRDPQIYKSIKLLLGSPKNDIQLEVEQMEISGTFKKPIDSFVLEFNEDEQILSKSQLNLLLDLIISDTVSDYKVTGSCSCM